MISVGVVKKKRQCNLDSQLQCPIIKKTIPRKTLWGTNLQRKLFLDGAQASQQNLYIEDLPGVSIERAQCVKTNYSVS